MTPPTPPPLRDPDRVDDWSKAGKGAVRLPTDNSPFPQLPASSFRHCHTLSILLPMQTVPPRTPDGPRHATPFPTNAALKSP